MQSDDILKSCLSSDSVKALVDNMQRDSRIGENLLEPCCVEEMKKCLLEPKNVQNRLKISITKF